MSLTFYFHPLSSYCQKAIIALYENETPFDPKIIDLSNEASRAELTDIWPVGKFPVLRDAARDRTVPESSIIIEYLAQHYPGRAQLVSADPDLARQVRMRDRFFDFYVSDPVTKIVTDRLRPAGKDDPYGVDQAKARLQNSLAMIDRDMATKVWAMGDSFSMADCAAAPALFYANMVAPFVKTHVNAAAYLRRLSDRPSYARVLKEAQPYLALVPK